MKNYQEEQALKICKSALNTLKNEGVTASFNEFKKAITTAPESEKVLRLATLAIFDAGEQDLTLELLQFALTLTGETLTWLTLITDIAKSMKLYDMEIKFLSRQTNLDPYNPLLYARLIDAMRLAEQGEDALELSEAALERFPTCAALWNAHGLIVLNTLGQLERSRTYFKKAVELDPKSAIYRFNYGHAIAFHPAFTEEQYRLALALAPKNAEINTALGILLLDRGAIEEGWQHYAYRADPSTGSPIFTHNLKPWLGRNPSGKSLLLAAEQGIGDELLFAIMLPTLIKDARHVSIGCEPRLMSLYKRNYPNMTVSTFEDKTICGQRYRSFPAIEEKIAQKKIDTQFAALIGDTWAYYIKDYDDLNKLKPGYLRCDPDLSNELKKLDPTLKKSAKRPRIGLSWRSGNMEQVRKFYYMEIDFVIEIMRQIDADFYCLQYDCTQEELQRFEAEPNGTVWRQFDLKQDIEFNFALLDNLDLVIGPATATHIFAIAAGVPAWLVNLGRPWFFFGRDDIPPFYPKQSRFWNLGDLSLQGKSKTKIALDIATAIQNFQHS